MPNDTTREPHTKDRFSQRGRVAETGVPAGWSPRGANSSSRRDVPRRSPLAKLSPLSSAIRAPVTPLVSPLPVLLVDDEAPVRAVLTRAIERREHLVSTATDRADALR
jgi:PleD family two-component response regulator